MKFKHSPFAIGLAACQFQLQPGSRELQLLPAGHFRSAIDGRPGDVPGGSWFIDAALAQRVITKAQARANPLVIDYEHQTLNAEKNGQPAPASGWWDAAKMVWREGQGLFVTDVDWTDNASAKITAREYKFFSPVFKYDKKTGAVTEILMGAITNFPAIDGMEAIAARAAARFDESNKPDEEIEPMKDLLKLLGLKEDATEAEAITAVKGLQTKITEGEQAIAAAKTQAPDPAKFVSIETHTKLAGDFTALKTDLETRDLNAAIAGAIDEGRLPPGEEQWAREFAKQHGLVALKASLEKRPVIAALKRTQTDGKRPEHDNNGELTDEQIAVCRSMGLSEEEYKKTLGKKAA